MNELENQGEKNHEFMVRRNVVMSGDGAPNAPEAKSFSPLVAGHWVRWRALIRSW